MGELQCELLRFWSEEALPHAIREPAPGCDWPLAGTEHLTLGYQGTTWPEWLIRARYCQSHQILGYCHTLEEASPGSAPSKSRGHE